MRDFLRNRLEFPLIFALVSASNGTGCANTETSWTGTRQLGVAGAETTGTSITSDTSSNVYITGYTTGGLDGNSITGDLDFYVTKYDRFGTKQWTQQLGASGRLTLPKSIATDSSSNIYVAGYTYGGLDGNSLTGLGDCFVTKYNSDGTKQWTRQLGVSGAMTTCESITTDSSSNIYVAGGTGGILDQNSFTSTGGFFFTKYNSEGTYLWTRQASVSAPSTYGYSITTDSASNVYVGGTTDGGLDGNSLTGTKDFFVTKYNSEGTKQWTRQLGASGSITFNRSLATDSSSNIYVGGTTNGGLDGNSLTGLGDCFVTKYNSDGTKQWTRQLGVSGAMTTCNSIAKDSSSNISVAGYTAGGLEGNPLTGIRDCFVTQFNSAGTRQWTRQLGVSGSETSGHSIATDSSSNIYVGGTTNGGLDGNSLTGTKDFFITSYTNDGTKR